MHRWLTIFTLIGCCCVTCSKARSPCKGLHSATSDVHGLIGENISLTCKVPTNCIRGYWRYDNTSNAKWLLPGQYSGDTYLFRFNSSEGLYTLHIHNTNERVEGFYTCLCDDYYGNRTTHACFNLSVHVEHCPISVQINGEKRVFDSCSTRREAEILDVKVNDNVTIKCDDEAERSTNCSHIGKRFSFTVNPYHHLCSFSCRPKKEGVNHEVISIILNVTDNVISTSTMKLYANIFSSTITASRTAWPSLEMISIKPPSQDTPVTTKIKTRATSSLFTQLPSHSFNLSHIIIQSSLILVFGIVVLSTCACVLFYKTGVCKSTLRFNTQTAGDVYHDILEMQSPDTNLVYTRQIYHRTDLENNGVILSDIDDITNDSVGFQFYDEPDAYFTVNKVGPKVSMDGTVGKAVYNKVQKTPVEMTCTLSYSPNTGGDMDT
ncbi:hypothetical protein HOLleu_24662 [Holothuria leucospilota]|uniref:Ig-like domain-containing protein n=1 Tax=Holothuria leucospilota TaxID=206669 RepID=A0A9Q1BRH6_HOLLE|nr:hypothetical protein HOLleu_24662 [Holothuria leucospilota]